MSSRRALKRPRRRLPFEDWPLADQDAWTALFREGDLLDGRGAACHWSGATRRTNHAHYARWLGWLAAEDRLEPGRAPTERASLEAVETYARALLAEVAPRTVASSLIGLTCVLQRMASEADWSWLRRMTTRLDGWAKPSRALPMPVMTVPEMFEWAAAELDRLSRIPAPKPRVLMAYRDTLIVALLLACPLRLRNLTMMVLGRHLLRLGGEWHLRFEPHETKTGQALHLVLPRPLTLAMDTYLVRIRPAFPGAASHDKVWVAQKGRAMAYETIYDRVRLTSEQLFGAALHPHAFRSLAATLLAETSPEDALHARPLLGHRQPTTTERYYIRANQLSAARKVAAALREIRDAEGPES